MVVPWSATTGGVVTVALRGEFGDTRVEPARLFDAGDLDGPGPPAGSVDVQFRAPLSFSLLVEGLFGAGRELDAQTCFTVYEQAMDYSVDRLQFGGGYVVDEAGDVWPARLELTTLGESEVPGFAEARVHHHVWVGPTAVTLADGIRRPVDHRKLKRVAGDMAWGGFRSRLQELSEEALGVTWGREQPCGYVEITDPPVHELLLGQDLGLCLSPWRTSVPIWEQPSAEVLERHATDLADYKDRAARGTVYQPPGRVLDY